MARPLTTTTSGTVSISTAQKKFGAASALFPGTVSTDRMSISYDSGLDIDKTSYQIKFQMYCTSNAQAWYIMGSYAGSASTGWSLQWYPGTGSNGYVYFYDDGTGNTILTTTLTTAQSPLNQWNAVCVEFYSSKIYLYINGTLINSGGSACTGNYTCKSNPVAVGGPSFGSAWGYAGYIDELRFYAGTEYNGASSYTPETAAFTNNATTRGLFHFDTNWADDNQTTNIKKVSGVAYASIKKISGVAIASVKKVAGVA